MKNKISQRLKLSNRLILSNKILLSLHLLERNITDLENEVIKIVEENPFLEMDIQPFPKASKKVKKAMGTDDYMENTGTRVVTLRDHLMAQLHVMNLNEHFERVVMALIDLLDIHGFLSVDFEDVSIDMKIPLEDVKSAAEILKSMDPTGVGSANVKEALKSQTSDPIVRSMIDFLEVLKDDPHLVMKKLNLSRFEFDKAFEKLKKLNPYPANGFADYEYTRYVEPDIIVLKNGDKFVVIANETFDVKFVATNLYEKLAESENESDRKFAELLNKRANDLVEALNKRKETLLKIGGALVNHEMDFLRGGKVVPLKIAEIAREIGLSLSTVARAISTKYIRTPRGVHSLRIFFSRAVYSSNKGNVSREWVKERIRVIISTENKAKPLSDIQIANELKRDGINLSRRVVTKYRKELMFPTSNKRREI